MSDKEKIIELQEKLSAYENDATYRGYYTLNKIVNQQIDYLQDFSLKTEIKKDTSDTGAKVFDRSKAIWEGLRSMISDLNALKQELKLSGDEEKDTKKVRTPFIETVAETRN